MRKEVRGIISKEELEAYGGADIMLMDAGNDSTDSGHDVVISGDSHVSFSFTYDTISGFVGVGWTIGTNNLETMIPDLAAREEYIEKYKYTIANFLKGDLNYAMAGCAVWTETAS